MAKRSVRYAAREAMQINGYDPLDVLVKYAQSEATSAERKFEVAQILLPYMYPKLSSITMEAEIVTSSTEGKQAELLRRVLEDPALADAAQMLSIAAAETALSFDSGGDSEEGQTIQ